MNSQEGLPEDRIVVEATSHQVEHFRATDPRWRVLQLPEGILLRYTLSQPVYFFLRTAAAEGKIATRVFANDSPYNVHKNTIGDVTTPMFETDAEARHLQKLDRLLRNWVNFIKDDADTTEPVTAHPPPERRN